MKKFLLLAVVMFANLTASAQQDVGTWSVIPKLGFNLANLAGDVSNNSIKFGLVVGGDVLYQVSPLVGVSAGAFYSVQGCEGTGDSSFSLGEINIPVLANFYVAQNFALKVGLQPGIIASAKNKSGDVSTSVTSSCQTIEISLPFGASYEISNFVIDARYNLGLSKINKDTGSIRNSVFQITVGYKIPF